MNVKLCRECRHSIPEPGSAWMLRCTHPEVIKRDPWALSGAKYFSNDGSSARDEREKRWFAPCGMKGKLWEAK